ncbi:MAG TPA: Zn-dependent exopeptidase M28, partial [Firmicutes bacterium]|nr:Zn-dependent exopeptidase M28 [Bacillota bacterium]
GFFLARPVPPMPVYDDELGFQTSQAMLYLSDLTTRFPRRDYAHAGRLAAAEWLAGELGRNGLEVYTQDFSEVIAGRRVEGLRNVFAVLPGEWPEAILVVAHYDIPPYVRQGAADDASGVATLLELARVFSAAKPRWTMIFLASDSEEYGAMWGSYRFLAESGWKSRLAAVVSLDFANLGEMKGIQLRNMGIQQGYTPLWLRELAKGAVARETLAIDPTPLEEWIERAVTVAPTEHGVYLAAGIPAVDLWGVPQDQPWQSRLYHTAEDTLEKIHPATIERYGRSAERLLRSLQQLDRFPPGEMRYFKLGRRYLPGGAVVLLQLLALLPLAVGVFHAWRRVVRGRASEAGTKFGAEAGVKFGRVEVEVRAEVRRLAALFLAGCLGYLVLWASSETGLMVKYELYPATQKDPVLDNPQLLPLVLVMAALVGGYALLRRLLRATEETSPEVRRAVALSGLLLLAAAAILGNGGFAALAFLAPALYLWPLARPARNQSGQAFNLILAFSALTVFVAFVLLFAKLYFIGQVWWYILMATAYGLFRARAVLAFLFAVALFLRFTSAALTPASAS